MDDLIAFVRAQLDEDERVAQAASPGPWEPNAEHDEVLAADDITVAEGFALSGNQLRATVEHIARWDPARVLAEVKAKRLIIEAEQDRVIQEGQLPERMRDLIETDVISLLAQPYAGREGWREEWRC